MPAHADIWGVGYPGLVISCDDGQTLLNPTDNGGVYQAVEALLDEFTPLFGNQVIHFGGDEVEDLTCWNQSAEVQAFMKANGIPNVNEMRNYFESKLQAIAQAKGLDAMFWEVRAQRGRPLPATARAARTRTPVARCITVPMPVSIPMPTPTPAVLRRRCSTTATRC